MKNLLLILLTATVSISQAQQADYSKWNDILTKYVSTSGKVNYSGIKKNKASLDAAITAFASATPAAGASKDAKLAYYMNLYNAYTIKLIVDNYPTTSITKLEGGKPWDKKYIPLGKATVSLNYIENDVLRKMGDPRIHFGINCASVSCPKLYNKAFTAANTDGVLASLAKEFVNDGSKNNIAANKLVVSEIFNWFGGDFKTSKTSIIDFLNQYSKVKINATAPMTHLSYNWNLNE